MKFLIGLIVIISFSFCAPAYSIVDYSDNQPAKTNGKTQAPVQESRSMLWKSDFSFSSDYEALTIDSEKVGVLNLNTHLQTPFNIYFDVSYWNANTKVGSNQGNPKAIIGFNWLHFGSVNDEARLDFYGGAKMSSSSLLGSSRNDKIFGFETTKRFGTFGLGLGYEMTMPGTPKNSLDLSLGNITRISISGGWMVSSDIQFELEAETFKINQSSETTRLNYLMKNVSFSTLSPKLSLIIAPAISLELGARFRTNKPKSTQDLAKAKIFDLHGAYSNSLFAGLSLTL